MERIRSAIEIAMEKTAGLGELTDEEKERLKDEEWLRTVLADYHRERIGPEELWHRLKEKNKEHLLKTAQLNLIESLSIRSTDGEIERRKDGILAIESLKKHSNTSVLESHLEALVELREKMREEKERMYGRFRSEVERNPELRVKQREVQTEKGTMIIQAQLTVDEAVNRLPEWKEFLAGLERKYEEEFTSVTEELKRETAL